MADPVAVLQFVQGQTIFGSDSHFDVFIAQLPSVRIKGGRTTNIGLQQIGEFALRAEIDGYSSPEVTIRVARGDVVSLCIAPPADRGARTLGLFTNRSAYLQIIECGVTNITAMNAAKK